LAAQVPALSKAIIKQSVTKSLATKEKSFVVLKALTEAVGGGLENQASAVANSAKSALVAAESASLGGATSAGLAATVLSFLGVFFRTHPPKVYAESLSQLVPIVVQSMSNRYHRISLEAFAAASSLAKGLRPQALAGNASPLPNLYGSSIQQIYSGTYAILSDTSADADVKERALVTLGDLLAYEGDSLSGQFEECLPTITARLGNDATQLTALKVIAAISESSNCQGQIFELWLNSVLEQFPMIFRRGQKATKSTALHSLPSLMTR
jgi:cullin-associated NEDD8-dissociated protein 1